ncbi:hypothetical protein [Azospirillum canadense]|uniref:hypothetical protein n=1 Tax=Azospirillum canadense TaxID=403962 RepID=UPI002226659D|nr:hypothetical protein [Azospirillum canadense]MCW2244229.1 hypothetical protein [Azospirillum canadense]
MFAADAALPRVTRIGVCGISPVRKKEAGRQETADRKLRGREAKKTDRKVWMLVSASGSMCSMKRQ